MNKKEQQNIVNTVQIEGHCLSIPEVADYWKVGTSAVYTAIKLGRLRAFKVGVGWRITPEAIKEYEKEQAKCQTSEFQEMMKEYRSKIIMKIV